MATRAFVVRGKNRDKLSISIWSISNVILSRSDEWSCRGFRPDIRDDAVTAGRATRKFDVVLPITAKFSSIFRQQSTEVPYLP